MLWIIIEFEPCLTPILIKTLSDIIAELYLAAMSQNYSSSFIRDGVKFFQGCCFNNSIDLINIRPFLSNSNY